MVAVQAPAVDGRANTAVVMALADALGVRPRQVTMIRGQTARTKLVEFPDDCRDAYLSLLDA